MNINDKADLVEQVANTMSAEFGDGEPNEYLAKELITLISNHVLDEAVARVESLGSNHFAGISPDSISKIDTIKAIRESND